MHEKCVQFEMTNFNRVTCLGDMSYKPRRNLGEIDTFSFVKGYAFPYHRNHSVASPKSLKL